MSLLLLSNESDYSLDRVIFWLKQNHSDLPIQRINREHLEATSEFTAVINRSGWTTQTKPKVAWLRQFLPERDPYGSSLTSEQIDDLLVQRRQWLAWIHLISNLGTRWMNDPFRVRQAESKICQLAIANQLEFDIPKTVLTCDRGKAIAFAEEHGPCIVKSLSAAYWEFSDQSFVFTIDAQNAFTADAISWQTQPALVQEKINGSHDARLLLIGRQVVGALRPRTSVDWRTTPDVSWSSWNPDHDTIKKVCSYADEFSLDYGGFDFILGSDDHTGPVFLECNPSGEFGFLDDALNCAPSSMIGRLLVQLYADTK